MKIAVVTGADGFIGTHLLHRLVQNGVEVWALVVADRCCLERINFSESVHIIQCDFERLATYANRLPANVDVFYHLAWNGVAPETRDKMELQIRNIPMTLEALRLAKTCNAKKFVFPGSTTEYMYSNGLINQDVVPAPQNAYGAAKLSARYFCEQLARQLDISFIYAVITGVYGGDRIDNNVISYTIQELLDGRCPKLTKAEQLWDYIHISDLTKALYLVAEKGKNGTFYTIGHGDNQPLVAYLYQIRDCINPQLPLGIGEIPYSYQKLPSSCVDLTNIINDTGFFPEIPFSEGIQEVIQQIKERKKRLD